MSAVVHVTTLQQYKDAIEQNPRVVVDFHASWCGPCRMIDPFLGSLAEENKENVLTLKVDVDELREVAEMEEVRAMPTFKLYKDGTMVSEFSGASKDKLRAFYE